MSRRRRKRSAPGVSLFPFLAVLICTLGVLIVLLVLAARDADVRSSDQVAQRKHDLETQQRELDDLQSQYDIRMVQTKGLTDLRPEILKRLTAARENRGHLESSIRELQREQAELAQALLELDLNTVPTTNRMAIDRATETLKQQIADSRSELEEKRNFVNQKGPVTWSIVPYGGNGGTSRRPIFIECTADAMVLQPLGIRIAKSEFTPPLRPRNMLDSALLAIREYWQQHDLDGDDGSPYPLLVVRPDAAETYVLARRAMSSWDDEFGYELVEAEKQLEFGTHDEQLKQIVEAAIEDARKRQLWQQRARRMANRNVSGGSVGSDSTGHGERKSLPGLTASGANGGFVANSDWNRESTGQQTESANRQMSAATEQNAFAAQNANAKPLEVDQTSALGHYTDSGTDSDQATSGDSQSAPASSQIAQGENQTATAGTPGLYQDLSLANQRGKNWALPTQTPGATAYVRPIRVVCTDDSLEIRSGLGIEQTIVFGTDLSVTADKLVDGIWKQIDSWGLSGNRSYWKPELKISVLPGGELNFEKLAGLLHESGITVDEVRR